MKDEILNFWFGDDQDVRSNRNEWWQKDDEFDARVAERFGDAVERALDGAFEGWADTPDGCLALVILLDQFTRNIFRGTPRAFAGDPRALRLSRHAIEREFDLRLGLFQRAFFYMPLEHAEDPEAQKESIAAFEGLLEDADPDLVEAAEMFLDFAHKHKAIIDRFGRYPHRNKILGRETTEEEAEFLKQPNSSF